jgi:hypothetical protein
MGSDVPRDILEALTRVKLPGGVRPFEPRETIEVRGMACPVYRSEALVLGSGAAGLRAAVELKRDGIDVAVCTTGLFAGTSVCSGSDKQTIHTAGTACHGDDFIKLAADIGSGGAMDADTAYVEAVGSIPAFAGLQYLGLPLPQDRFGAVLRYQTDHDDVGRATSCGPRTSTGSCAGCSYCPVTARPTAMAWRSCSATAWCWPRAAPASCTGTAFTRKTASGRSAWPSRPALRSAT